MTENEQLAAFIEDRNGQFEELNRNYENLINAHSEELNQLKANLQEQSQ
jgi:hypothetical protein